VRLYDRLFRSENPEESGDFLADLNPDSLKIVTRAKLEPSVRSAIPMTRYQFERLGYFCVDADSSADRLVFNRTATLKDTWAKIAKD
jgi:glutaminyl-tRNA synthetase